MVIKQTANCLHKPVFQELKQCLSQTPLNTTIFVCSIVLEASQALVVGCASWTDKA